MTRITALFLVLALITAVGLAACGPGAEPEPSPTGRAHDRAQRTDTGSGLTHSRSTYGGDRVAHGYFAAIRGAGCTGHAGARSTTGDLQQRVRARWRDPRTVLLRGCKPISAA